jgi:ubiquitin carboxyl-terminal hydrolase 14
VVVKPDKAVEFLEDMTVAEQIETGAVKPSGLANLGNTCYMNATVECLRYMPELREAFTGVSGTSLTTSLRSTFTDMDRSGNSIPPYSFVATLRGGFPQYAEMNAQRTGEIL